MTCKVHAQACPGHAQTVGRVRHFANPSCKDASLELVWSQRGLFQVLIPPASSRPVQLLANPYGLADA